MQKSEETVSLSRYKCNVCGCYVEREGTKAWRKSYCEKTGRNARLYLVGGTTKNT